jgi:hypothetical protein
MRRRQKIARARNNIPQLESGRLYRFTFSDDIYCPTTVVAVVTSSGEKDVLQVARVEGHEQNDTRKPLEREAIITLNPGVVTAEMMIPDQPIPTDPR